MPTATIPDAPKTNWLDRFAPAWLVPYGRLARWDRPIGWRLLLWPCWWAAALAAIAAERSLPDLWHLALFMVGAIAMRGAGCTYNDLVDRDIDAMVERTRARPIPSGAVSPMRAVTFLGLQALAGLIVLLQFNRFTIALGFASLLVVAFYPFMKRISDWPQFVLGLAFSWGALVGWTAQFGSLAWPPVLLYAAAISWTIGYDTIYAHQDKEDDAIIGVRSTARLFGARTKPALLVFYSLAVILMAAAFALAGAGLPAFSGLLAAAAHLGWQVVSLEIDDADNCLARFRANRMTGWIIFAGLVLDALLSA
ncbi:MAG: 4-hydroxybenzoate octaprenyltransferase [Hyphomicrobiales bacterium]|nr:4-hydroxybenzoate octaprenyltransferase [Hyphomicrobiales bacterium]